MLTKFPRKMICLELPR